MEISSDKDTVKVNIGTFMQLQLRASSDGHYDAHIQPKGRTISLAYNKLRPCRITHFLVILKTWRSLSRVMPQVG
jgi:hypothetical protein